MSQHVHAENNSQICCPHCLTEYDFSEVKPCYIYNFPRPQRLRKRAVGWLSTNIQNWIESRPKGGCWEDQS